MPVLFGAAADDDLSGRSTAVHTTVLTMMWVVWLIALIAMLVPTTVSLTTVRGVLPLPMAFGIFLVFIGPSSGGTWAVLIVALAASLTALGIGFSAPIGRLFAQGSAYGDESRFPLRPPGPMLAGPILVVWALTTGTPIAAVLLLAARQWVAGALVLLIAIPLSAGSWRGLHALSRRWLVFVPAGLVVHDPLVLADNMLARRSTIASFGPALADTTAEDLTARALGLALEISFRAEVTVALAGRRGAPGGTVKHVQAVLVAPSRPGDALAEARRRRLLPD